MKKHLLHITTCAFALQFVLVVLAPFSSCFTLSAQDDRNRATSTIIADGLAQLPAKSLNLLQQVMGEMAATGSEGMQMLISYLAPAVQGKNAKFEYAIDGIVSYVSQQEHGNLRDAIRQALRQGIEHQTDIDNKAFLISQLQRIATTDDITLFAQLLNHPQLSEPALAAIAAIGDTHTVTTLLSEGTAPKALLARLAVQLPTPEAEPILLQWAGEADSATLAPVYSALAECGTEQSYPLLHKAAQAVGFSDDPTGATEAYLRYLCKNTRDSKMLTKAAKELMTCSVAAVRNTGLILMTKALAGYRTTGNAASDYHLVQPAKATSMLFKALRDTDRQYRNTALSLLADAMKQWPGEKKDIPTQLTGIMPKLSADAQTDIVRWLGNHHLAAHIDAVAPLMLADNEELSSAAIRAAGQMGGDKALAALINMLHGDKADEAGSALLTFNGNINKGVLTALHHDNADVRNAAMQLASARHIYSAYPRIVQLLNADGKPNDVAYAALKGVVQPANFNALCDLLDHAQPSQQQPLQEAAKVAIATLKADAQYQAIAQRLSTAPVAAAYYPLLAQAGTKEAVALLGKAYNEGDKQALDALLSVNTAEVLPLLYDIAKTNGSQRDRVLTHYLTLTKRTRMNRDQRFQHLQQALALQPAPDVTAQYIAALADINNQPALTLAASYLNTIVKSNSMAPAFAAANTVKTIISKNKSLHGCEGIHDMLVKAVEIYKVKRQQGNTDAGYAIDELNGLLEKVDAQTRLTASVNALTDEERRQGFELLFDGQSLDKWFGNKTNYVPDNGTIYVSAGYGNGGNLYTNKTYSDFVYRFEFCFLEEGVNNGVGIRTREGVDAAYEGMEIQILDHDAPIYAGLRDYQQHGSVYGIIVPKHVNFGPVGTWHSEEIRAVGDHITVTVDGEVILDGNIREACQGHNVAPDGGKHNPYTIDHNNHPGLFNREGNISFCGHGEGVRFRNIRILDLSSKGKKAKR